MEIRVLVFVVMIAAAAVTTDVFGPDGQRAGRIVESPGGRVDLYDAESNRAGWGRRNADGSTEVFSPSGERLGTITRDGKTLWLNRPGSGGKRK